MSSLLLLLLLLLWPVSMLPTWLSMLLPLVPLPWSPLLFVPQPSHARAHPPPWPPTHPHAHPHAHPPIFQGRRGATRTAHAGHTKSARSAHAQRTDYTERHLFGVVDAPFWGCRRAFRHLPRPTRFRAHRRPSRSRSPSVAPLLSVTASFAPVFRVRFRV